MPLPKGSLQGEACTVGEEASSVPRRSLGHLRSPANPNSLERCPEVAPQGVVEAVGGEGVGGSQTVALQRDRLAGGNS